MTFRKEVTLIGDLAGARDLQINGAWLRTDAGPRYRMGRRDTFATIADRYLGSAGHGAELRAMQTPDVRARAGAPGTLLVMPPTAIATAEALGLLASSRSARGDDDEIGAIFYTPTDAESFKDLVHANVTALQETVNRCGSMSPLGAHAAEYDAWNAFVISWMQFRGDHPSWMNAGQQYHQCEAYQTDVEHWAAQISSMCGPLAGPVAPAPPKPSVTPPLAAAAGAYGAGQVIGLAIVGVVAWMYFRRGR